MTGPGLTPAGAAAGPALRLLHVSDLHLEEPGDADHISVLAALAADRAALQAPPRPEDDVTSLPAVRRARAAQEDPGPGGDQAAPPGPEAGAGDFYADAMDTVE